MGRIINDILFQFLDFLLILLSAHFVIEYIGSEKFVFELFIFLTLIKLVNYSIKTYHMRIENNNLLYRIWTLRKDPEDWTIELGWWIPRKYRAAVIGDIIEDCHEMRIKNCGEFRICIHVLWQCGIAIVTLIPTAIVMAAWRIICPSK